MGSLSNTDNQLAEEPFDGHKDLETIVGQMHGLGVWALWERGCQADLYGQSY